MHGVNAIRDQTIQDNWQQISSEETPAAILMLVCIDFLRSFDHKIYPSCKKQDYHNRSKQNLRRRRLMHWTIKFVQILKSQSNELNPEQTSGEMEPCYSRLARLLVN